MKINIIKASFFFLLFWFAFLGLSGTLGSGFHFIDDHQIIAYSETVSSGAIRMAVDCISDDISIGRLRPAYYIHRLLQVKFFGADFFLWGVYNGLLAFAGSSILSAAFLVLGFTLFEAVIFPLFMFLGFQSAVWWRFGPAETMGMPFLALLLLLSALGRRRRSLLLDAVFILSAVMLALTKESFIVFIPAALFLKLWLEKSGKGWLETARLNALPLIVLLAWSAAQLLFVKFYVKSTGIGYAGYYGFDWAPFLLALIKYFFFTQAWVIAAGVALAWPSWTESGRKFMAQFFPLLLFMALALVPQSLLYARSGVYERYLFPGVFAVAFAAIYLLKAVRESRENGAPPGRWYAGWAAAAAIAAVGAWTMRSGDLRVASIATGDYLTLSSVAAWFHFESGRGLFVLVMVFLLLSAFRFRGSLLRGAGPKTFLPLLLVWAILYNFTLAFDRASGSAFEGLSTGELLASIERNTGKEDLIAVVADPALNFEAAHSLNLYLTVKMGRTDVYAYPVLTMPSYDSFHSTLIPMFGRSYKEKVIREEDGPLRAARAFVVFPGAEKKFLAGTSGWFRPEKFARHANRFGYVTYFSPAQIPSHR